MSRINELLTRLWLCFYLIPLRGIFSKDVMKSKHLPLIFNDNIPIEIRLHPDITSTATIIAYRGEVYCWLLPCNYTLISIDSYTFAASRGHYMTYMCLLLR